MVSKKLNKNKSTKENNRGLKSLDSLDLGTKEWEDAIMFPLKILKIVLGFYTVFSLIVPIYVGSGLLIDSFSTVLVIIVMVIGVLERHGRAFYINPLFTFTFIRVVHFLLNFFFFKEKLNYVFYFLIVFLELGLSMLILMDKTKYECVKERKI